MRAFLCAPKIFSIQDLHDQVVRISWYLAHLKDCKFSIDTDLSLDAVRPASYIDSSVVEKIVALRATGRLVVVKEVERTEWDGVIAWKGVAAARQSFSGRLLDQYKSGDLQIYNVDREHRMEGSLYIDIANRLSLNTLDIAKFHCRFKNLASELGCENAYLFCTGPSVGDYANFNFRRGLSIICNSVIFDEELLMAVNPKILVFADPIFHFGCSSYAERFRKKLLEVVDRYDLTLIVPVKYVNIFLAGSPQLEHRLIAVPYDKNVDITLDLCRSFKAFTTDNILTFLMIPVAASISNKLYLLGCDGRKLEDDSYFWAHNDKTQISSEMANIQQAHPSFFKLDYNDYYLRHCETLERYAEIARMADQEIIGLTFSHIDALKLRPYPYSDLSNSDRVYVSINPDLADEFGHFHHFDVRIQEVLPHNSELVVWANRAAYELKTSLRIDAVFRKNTYHVRTEFGEDVVTGFKRSLQMKLEGLSLLSAKKVLYMYTGDVLHARAIIELAQSYSELFRDTHVHINLFWAHFDLDAEAGVLDRLTMYQNVMLDAQEIANEPIKLYVDSKRAKYLVDGIAGPGLNEWPMIQISSLGADSCVSEDEGLSKSHKKVRVFCPATGQKSKGYHLAVKAIGLLIQKGHAEDYIFRMRDMLRDNEVNNLELQELQDSLKSQECVQFLVGAVSDEDYLAEYEQADLILLPYSRDHFYSRTSGAVVDALFYAKPVICVSDTWLEEEAGKFGLAYGFLDGEIEDCVNKIIEAVNLYPKPKLSRVREIWRREYAPSRLLDCFDRVEKQVTLNNILASNGAVSILARAAG